MWTQCRFLRWIIRSFLGAFVICANTRLKTGHGSFSKRIFDATFIITVISPGRRKSQATRLCVQWLQLTSKKTSTLRITDLFVWGIYRSPVVSPKKAADYVENVSMAWRIMMNRDFNLIKLNQCVDNKGIVWSHMTKITTTCYLVQDFTWKTTIQSLVGQQLNRAWFRNHPTCLAVMSCSICSLHSMSQQWSISPGAPFTNIV